MIDDIWLMEDAWWTMGAAEARRRMHPSCVLVRAMGMLHGEQILAMIDSGPRWTSVKMTDRHQIETEDCIVLAYRVHATRNARDYAAVCSSTWVPHDDNWQLIQHQQTELADS